MIASDLAYAQGSAKVGCTAEDNGAPATASFRVLRDGAQIASGVCGRDVEVPPGPVTLAVALDGALAVKAQLFPLEAKPGTPARTRARFETGELLVEVTRDGRRSPGLVELSGGGERARLSAGVTSRVSVGTYVLEVESRGERRRVEGVQVARGERRVVSVAFGGASK